MKAGKETIGKPLPDLELPRDPEAAVDKLRLLLSGGAVVKETIAIAAGGIAVPGAAELLAEMETSATGGLRREIRRALFKLRQKGIEPPARPSASASSVVPAADGNLSARISPVDADGAQFIWLSKGRAGGGVTSLWGLVSERDGLISVSMHHFSRREVREQLREFQERAQIRLVDADWRLADYLLTDAFRRTPEEKRTSVGDFLTLRAELIGRAPVEHFEHPVYAEFADELARDPSPELAKQPEIAAALIARDDLQPYLAEIQEIRQSPLVLNRMQQEERIDAVARNAVGQLFAGERGTILRRRLENIAYYLARSGKHEEGGWAASAAARLREGADLAQVPFFAQLARERLGLAFTEQVEQEKEQPRLIMTPAEAMRAQAQRQQRRR